MDMIRKLLDGLSPEWGVCRFESLPPLLNVRSRSRLPADPKSVIVILFGYYTEKFPNRNISRYAVVDDYHTVLQQKLGQAAQELERAYAGEAFIPFIDSSPIAEVRAAVLAGLGQAGKNGQLLNPVFGSYCFIGEIITTLALPPAAMPAPDLCTKCKACLAACPTGALSEMQFQKEICRSYITQKKGELTNWEREQIRKGGFAWGCDCCLEACPVNRNVQQSQIKEFYEHPVPVLTAENVQKLCESKAYGWRGEKVLLRNLSCIAGRADGVEPKKRDSGGFNEVN